MQIKVIRGAEACAMLADERFRAEWTSLAKACPWATPMQSHAFADAWYSVYGNRFEPVLITSRDAEGRLDGLLALAYGRKRTLIPVGGHQAEYHCWISTPAIGNDFGRESLRAAHRHFPSSKLTFRYLPPDVPLRWLSDAPDIASVSMMTAWRRPLMRLDDETIRERFSRKNIRTRVNKLQRMGYAGIERITDVDGWDATFDQFIGYHDMRRIAASGNAPFADDSLKKQFHVELMRRGTVPLCVTTLRVGDEVVSAQMDLVGERDTHLALGAYAPWMSRHAVGKIHILELARMMMEEGRTRLDLTPGDDPYKADFATDWDTVQVFTCYPNRRSLWAAHVLRALERAGRRVLQRLNTTPARARMVASEMARRPLAAIASAMLAARDKWWSRDQTVVYTRRAPNGGSHSGSGEAVLSRNSIRDIMAYRPRALDMATHAYMAQVGDRFSDGMTAYTRVEQGRLRYAGWVTDQPGAVLDEETCRRASLPDRCGVVFDVQSYRSGAGPDLTARVMEELVASAERQVPTAKTAVVLVPAANRSQRAIVEAMGFRRAETLNRSLGLNSLRPPPLAEMFAILSAAAAAILLWGYMRLSDVHSADQGTMPVVAEVIETMS